MDPDDENSHTKGPSKRLCEESPPRSLRQRKVGRSQTIQSELSTEEQTAPTEDEISGAELTLDPHTDYVDVVSKIKQLDGPQLEVVPAIVGFNQAPKKLYCPPRPKEEQPSLFSVKWPKWLTRMHFQAKLKQTKLIWVEGVIEFLPKDPSMVSAHACLVLTSLDFIAVFNPGVKRPSAYYHIGKPRLLRHTLEAIIKSPAFKSSRNITIWYKTVMTEENDCRHRCWLEAKALSSMKTTVDTLLVMGYEPFN
jgi:hypothetical protein